MHADHISNSKIFFFVSLHMHTNEENVVKNEAIVLEWVVSITLETSKLSKCD